MQRLLIVGVGGVVTKAASAGGKFVSLDDAHQGLDQDWEFPVPGRAAALAPYRDVVDRRCCVGELGHLGVNSGMAGSSVLGISACLQAGAIWTVASILMPSGYLYLGGAVKS